MTGSGDTAGRASLFLFGTLMDADVMARVLARPSAGPVGAPAWLEGYRRERAAGASYPVLLPDPRGTVEGRLLRSCSARDLARIDHFESEEYRAVPHRARTADGIRHTASVYLALEVAYLAASGEPWDLDAWRQAHKEELLAACDGWMAGFVELA